MTPLCRELGIEVPIIQAPMAGGITTPELVASVSEAGALGAFGFAYTQPEAMHRDAERVRALTGKPFCVNMFLSKNAADIEASQQHAALEALGPYFDELGLKRPTPVKAPYAPDHAAQLDAVEAIRPAVFTFHLGDAPADRVAALRAKGIKIGGSATCVAEARRLESLGVDFIVAQGAEAGGHRGTYLRDPYEAMTGTFALTRLIVRAVRIPVVAAGGIMDGAGIAAVLALGAQAAQLGTAFVTCTDSGASSAHKAAILAAEDDTTLITEKFSGKPARGIVNRYMRELAPHEDSLPDFPLMNTLTAPLRKAGAESGNPDFLALWSGQAVGLNRRGSVGELVERMVAEAQAAMRRLSARRN
jgi:nitronate monooxygenase